MNIWHHLGINPTEDKSLIRKAYVQKLKQHHPEEDPEGYQKLREAYDQAILNCKRKSQSISHTDEDEDEHVFIFSSHSMNVSFHEGRTQEDPLQDFMEKVHAVYNNMASRIELTSWLNLMQEDVMWNIRLQYAVREQMSGFIDQHPHLPRGIWGLLESSFHWKDAIRKDRDSFARQFPNIFLHVFADPLYSTSLRYTYIKQFEELETYLDYRLKALMALKEKNMQLTEEMLTKAHALFADDPDLLRLRGEFYLRQGNLIEALTAVDHCIRIVPNDLDLYLVKARVNYARERFNEVLRDLEYILSHQPEHLDALALAGKCYMRLREIENAKEMYQRITHIQPFDIEAVIQLVELDKKKGSIR
ncbi:J domain-containing protein [Paenibacillus sp. UNC451MF]|uniref:J domain-containing protein n=1 Tax=Paenibacillus sp. UNC451MF TaxID=1449063 RepID=UPI000490045F|nr:J domain-containing protein [Paenibacillus sp. UNC451MF]